MMVSALDENGRKLEVVLENSSDIDYSAGLGYSGRPSSYINYPKGEPHTHSIYICGDCEGWQFDYPHSCGVPVVRVAQDLYNEEHKPVCPGYIQRVVSAGVPRPLPVAR